MVKKLNILGIILARGGSKGIPKKNIRLLNSYPLIAYSIASALKSRLISRLIVSTDDEEIARIAKLYGAEVPFHRPAELAEDNTLDFPVIRHALKWLKDKEEYRTDIVVLLRPTSPLRPKGMLDNSIEILLKNDAADSVRGVTIPNQNPYKMWKKLDNVFISPLISLEHEESYNMPRQKLPETYWQTGHVDVIKAETITKKKSISGKEILPIYIENQYCIDIDRKEDLELAEIYIESDMIDIDRPSHIYLDKLANIELIVFDFDGVFTNNKVIIDENGTESVVCDRSDGMGISMIRKTGIQLLILSSEKNKVVSARGKKMNIMVFQSIDNKLDQLKNILSGKKINFNKVAYLGNDLNDLGCMKKVGVSICPNDSHPKIKKHSDIILNCKGGDGAIRELCELIMKIRK